MTVGFIFSIILAIVVPTVIIWVLVAYPKKYKQNINKALNDEMPVRSIEPTTLFGGLSLLILIALNIILVVSIFNMQDDINSLQNQINQMNNDISIVEGNISGINSEISQMLNDSKWIKRGSYELLSLDSDDLTADINILFEMNRIPSNGVITLIYKDEDNHIETKVLTSNTTIFETTLTLDIDGTYAVSLMIDDGTTIENEDLFTVDVNSKLAFYRDMQISFDIDGNENGETMTFIVSNDYSVFPELELVEMTVEIVLDGEVVYSDNMTEPTSETDQVQTFELTINPYHYGEGELSINITVTDQMGIDYIVFDEGWIIDNENATFS